MPRAKPGERVGALLSAKDGEVRLLGYGVYDGNLEPPRPLGLVVALFPPEARDSWEACLEHYRENIDPSATLDQIKLCNPRITLDSGVVVWGAECWWGPEGVVREKIKGMKVIEVDPRTVEGLQAHDPEFTTD